MGESIRRWECLITGDEGSCGMCSFSGDGDWYQRKDVEPVLAALRAENQQLREAAKDAIETLRVAVRCGLRGFSEKKTKEIVENHSTIQKLRAALAQNPIAHKQGDK